MSVAKAMRARWARFHADQRGTATVELVVWIPFFLLMLFVIVDASVFYWRYTAMWDTTRELARNISVGRYGIVGTETYDDVTLALDTEVKARLGSAFNAALIDGGSFDPALRVTADVSALSIFDFFGAFVANSPIIVTQVRLHKEPF